MCVWWNTFFSVFFRKSFSHESLKRWLLITDCNITMSCTQNTEENPVSYIILLLAISDFLYMTIVLPTLCLCCLQFLWMIKAAFSLFVISASILSASSPSSSSWCPAGLSSSPSWPSLRWASGCSVTAEGELTSACTSLLLSSKVWILVNNCSNSCLEKRTVNLYLNR